MSGAARDVENLDSLRSLIRTVPDRYSASKRGDSSSRHLFESTRLGLFLRSEAGRRH